MTSVVVAAPSGLAADAGAHVAESGGSVVDALVAATLTAMCTEPGVCAPGGGGYLAVWPAGGDPITIDGYMAMPGLGGNAEQPPPITTTVSMEYGGGITTDVGPGSIAVPGGLAALDFAHGRWGRAPWRQVVGHVAELLDYGFPLSSSCHYYLGYSGISVFGEDPASRAALHDGDRLRSVGETIMVDGLTASLRAIADDGAATFYRGDLARSIVADLTARGGRITRTDMARYRALPRPPLQARLGEWTVATNPPPAVGGVGLAAILEMVTDSEAPLDPGEWVRAQKIALDHRHEVLDLADDREEAGWEFLRHLPRRQSGSTVSISVAGSDGSVACATMSGGYGSGVIPHGTGLWMNNSLGEYELTPQGIDGIAAGDRLLSNMAPTVARGGQRTLAVGSPGADRITSALATALTLIVHADATLAEAIEHPRAHYEHARATVAVEGELDVGSEGIVVRRFLEPDMYFGGVTAAEFSDGKLIAHADSRRTGGVARGGSD